MNILIRFSDQPRLMGLKPMLLASSFSNKIMSFDVSLHVSKMLIK